MSSKKDTKVIRTRNTILIFVVVVVIAVLGYGTIYSTGVTAGEATERVLQSLHVLLNRIQPHSMLPGAR